MNDGRWSPMKVVLVALTVIGVVALLFFGVWLAMVLVSLNAYSSMG
jgi:hypothetical protein